MSILNHRVSEMKRIVRHNALAPLNEETSQEVMFKNF